MSKTMSRPEKNRAKLMVSLEGLRALLGLPDEVDIVGIGCGDIMLASSRNHFDVHVRSAKAPLVPEGDETPVVFPSELGGGFEYRMEIPDAV